MQMKLWLRNCRSIRSYCKNVHRDAAAVAEPEKNACLQRILGQPSPYSHPHLLREDEITPGLSSSEYQCRRENLVKLIRDHFQSDKRQIVVIPSATKKYISDKIPYVFRQNTDFLYFSGCQEPDSCLVITLGFKNGGDANSVLFVRERDRHAELWDGPRTGPADAVRFFGVNEALPVGELSAYLRFLLKTDRSPAWWYESGVTPPSQTAVQRIMDDVLRDSTTSTVIGSPRTYMHQLRNVKSSAEVALMQQSCDIAAAAISRCITTAQPGVTEHQIFAQVDYECRMRGAEFLAYPPVVAGGSRATTIHYIDNNQVVQNGDMVLMDAGCEFHGYSSDITRTWPVNGRFSSQQLELYEAVLSVQTELIEMCAHLPTLDKLFDAMCLKLGARLREIGLVRRNATTEELFKTAYKFCPHHVSHYLGMDVHDTGSISRGIPLKPGMIITVEPGVYISESADVPNEYKGIGIRIEDDVWISENGPVVLSRKCPKNPAEIEKLVNGN